MIKDIINIKGAGSGVDIVNTRFVRYMQPVINTELNPDSLDNSQCFLNSAFETPTEWRALFTGANTQDYVYPPDGRTYNNVDQVFLSIKTKSNQVRSGWGKLLDVNGMPKPVFQPTFIDGRFDKAQVWMRAAIVNGTTVRGWYIGDSGHPNYIYRIGYATSEDWGETWSRYSNDPIYVDDTLTAGRGIVVLRIMYDAALGKYLMFYTGIDPNINGFYIAQSDDGITGWSRTHANLLAGQNIGFIGQAWKEGSNYYIWVQKNFRTPSNFGPARDMYVYTSTDLSTWTSVGRQFSIYGEWGVGPDIASFQKPNGEWFSIFGCGKNRVQALASGTQEPSSFVKLAESPTRIVNSSERREYPDYVVFHAPLGSEEGLVDTISNNTISINSSPVFGEMGFIRLSGSQTLTALNSGVITGANFAIKMRIEIKTTGTFELLRIGNDVLITLESGKFRTRLSSDGAGYEKDYITTVNISKPTGLDYIDNHIYVGFTWISSVLTLYNDFVPFDDATEITKTVNDSLTTVNNSGSNILLGQNAAIELRSVSILSGITDNEFIELDI